MTIRGTHMGALWVVVMCQLTCGSEEDRTGPTSDEPILVT